MEKMIPVILSESEAEVLRMTGVPSVAAGLVFLTANETRNHADNLRKLSSELWATNLDSKVGHADTASNLASDMDKLR